MATLTGFKAVGDQPSQQQQQQTNGQHNPVFVFDDVDSVKVAGAGGAPEAETFEDASSQTSQTNGVSEPAGPQTPPEPRKQVVSATGAQPVGKTAPAAGGQRTQPSARQQRAQQQHQQQQQQQHQQQQSPQQKVQKHTLSPNGMDGGELAAADGNGSQSVLAIDCAGSGKSPRQPRRSPLMALFRGKPRESVRRMYTDEDQFEIEWANLSLEVQKKWYQKVSLAGLLLGDGEPAKPERPRMILNSVDGRIRSGEITAVLGPSGAGKTSLLNSLFGKYRTAVQGSIKVTGAPSKKHLTVCTIPQSDFLIGYLTTEESLWFASRLKNCEDDFNHDRNIERVIELLGLQRCRHTRINKLSGGQYKRVSIAQEMLSSPDILVLDEPTSGLDSLTCYRTVKVLRDLVEASKAHNLVNPMSIILTIHQPHREVLDLFHSVYVMAVGGQTLYQGPPADMEAAINEHSGTSMPAQGYNPASFMVELASEEYGRKPIEALVAKQREKFVASTQHQYNFGAGAGNGQQQQLGNSNKYESQESLAGGYRAKTASDSTISLYPLDGKTAKDKYVDIDLSGSGGANATGGGGGGADGSGNGSGRDVDSRVMTPRSGKNSDGVFWRHVNLMSKRCFLSNTRDPLLCTIRVGAHIFIPLVVALIYGPKMGIPNGCPFYKPEINLLEYASMGVEEIQEKHDDIRIQFQNVGLHFMVYYAFGLCMLAFTAISFPLIMHVLIKEIRNGWYSLSTFIVGKMFAELPMAIILPPISVGIIYVMTGQPASYLQWRYLVQSLILVLIIMIAEAKGLIFGAVCMNSMQTAVFAASVSTVPFILLSGFLIRIREVPYVLQHLAKFSYFKHAVEALIITRYGFGMCPCDPELIPAGGTPRIIGIPAQIMSLTDYYINAYVAGGEAGGAPPIADDQDPADRETNVVGNNRNISRIVASITTLAPEVDGGASSESRRRRRRRRWAAAATSGTTTTTPTTTTANAAAADEDDDEEGAPPSAKAPSKQGVFFDKLATLLTRANAFGYSIQSCEDVEPFTMKDMLLKDSMLGPLIGYLFLYIVILKFISYFIVEICVKLKL